MDLDHLIVNVDILTWEGAKAVIRQGDVGLAHGRIALLETGRRGRPVGRAKQVLDGRDMLAMPGLVNLHCHAAMTLFRGMADDLQLSAWLNEHIFPAEARHVHPEMVYWCSKLAAAEMILSGTTTVADGYFHGEEAARAFRDAGIRAIAAQGIIDFPAPGVADPRRNLEVADAFLAAWKDRCTLVTPALFAHSPYTCSNRTITGAKELARRHGVPLFIHLAETGQEKELIRERKGSTPVRHLQNLGVLDQDTVCVHCVWCDERDLDILAAGRCPVVPCPQSHMKLASGIAPVASMLARDMRVGLGTDGPASNNGLDMFREMDLCAKLQKVATGDPEAVPAGAALAMGTGRLAGLPGTAPGSLEPGNPADLILLDCARPHLQPMYNGDLLVYAASGSDVDTVFIDGTMVMHRRQILTFDLDECLERVRRLAARVH